MPSIAIIGAGSSGLAAAHTLRDAGYAVTLFEQSAEVGGRATSRTRDGFTYDHGAQYIKQGSPASVSLITERFRAPDLIDIKQPVWIFDGQGRIQEGDPVQNAEPKWCYRRGLITLARQMAQGLDIHLGTTISRIQHTANGWCLFVGADPLPDHFDSLLITIPTPEALPLIQVSQLDEHMQERICSHLSQARYNPLLSVMLGYQPIPRSRPYYALVNIDKAHPISWLAWEHEKTSERAPAGSGLLIAQMAPPYSHEHWQTSDEAIVRDVARLVNTLIDETLPAPYFSDIQSWRYALPTTRANADALNAITLPIGLAFCGDAFVGGRVHLALEHGILVAQHLINR
ncbi:MAG TPA: FAD-dependent oxidoreductase [Ktedonosporobacter sp.]|nr:FAD-dependent oxidoreductase [Ktedonosporobacter sp.]